jgi:hypothetical protein
MSLSRTGRPPAAEGKCRSGQTGPSRERGFLTGNRGFESSSLHQTRRYAKRHWCASAHHGNGAAARRCCKAAPPTTPAWCSRPVQPLLRSAACVASITTMRSPAGASTKRARRRMSMRKRLAVCTAICVSVPALAQAPQFGHPIAPADIAPVSPFWPPAESHCAPRESGCTASRRWSCRLAPMISHPTGRCSIPPSNCSTSAPSRRWMSSLAP